MGVGPSFLEWGFAPPPECDGLALPFSRFWVGPCPSFSRVVVGLFLLRVGTGPVLLVSEAEARHAFLEWGVGPSWTWPFGVKVGPPFSEWVGPHLSRLVFDPSFCGFGLALSSRGVVVGLFEFVFGPSFLGLSLFVWELVLFFWCGSWSFLSWGVNFCPPFLAPPFSWCVCWAFLSGVRAGLPFKGFGMALARVSQGGGGLFLLAVGVRPPFGKRCLALTFMGMGLARGNWPFLAVEEVRYDIFEWEVGPSWTWPSE